LNLDWSHVPETGFNAKKVSGQRGLLSFGKAGHHVIVVFQIPRERAMQAFKLVLHFVISFCANCL
jgi:hypothetical protein